MLDAILDVTRGIIQTVPIEAVATIAVLVGAGGLILTGWRYLVSGIQGLFMALDTVLNALAAFFRALLMAFGSTVGGLVILAMGGIAVWWAFLILGGR